MKILFLSSAQSHHTKRWVDYFVDRGHTCFLVSLERGIQTKAEEFFIHSQILPSFLKYPLSVRKVKKIAEKIKPDLINAHFVPNYGLIGALLGQRPLAISTWGSDILISPQKSFLHKLRVKYVLNKADLITTDAKISTQAILDLGIKETKIIETPMGVDKNLVSAYEKKFFDSSYPEEKEKIGHLKQQKPGAGLRPDNFVKGYSCGDKTCPKHDKICDRGRGV